MIYLSITKIIMIKIVLTDQKDNLIDNITHFERESATRWGFSLFHILQGLEQNKIKTLDPRFLCVCVLREEFSVLYI